MPMEASYDAAGNVSRITDAVGNSTTYGYDAVDRLLTETNQLGFSRSRVYDAVGNQIEMVDRNGRKIVYGYDALNRRTSESWLDVNAQSIRLHSYSYNALGNLITAIEPDSKYSYGYDALNRLVTLNNAGTNGVPTVIFGYVYDGVGRLMSVSDRINGTNASQTSYAYDQLNRVTQITQSGAGVQNKRVDMVYNAVNQMTGLRRYSDLSGATLVAETSYVHDLNQRLTQLAHKRGANNLASYDYTYDAADKLTKIVSSIDGTVDYAYDATNQLTGANHTNQTDEAYQYDANGNRTNAGYQTGTNNQLLSDGQFTYEYDNEGNRTKRTETATGKVTEYVWDYRNRLTQVLFKDGTGAITKNVEYVYDVNNLRIGKKIDGVVTERFAIDRNQIALVFDGQGVQKSRYLYGTEVDQVLAEESGAQVHWFLADHQGTVKDVVDNAGAIVDHVTYDSFGRIVGQTGNIELRFAYTGREWDGETGQYYYRARYYDAVVGRFISEDPIGFNAGDSNLSRYVSNSPAMFVDPSGYLVKEALSVGQAAADIGKTVVERPNKAILPLLAVEVFFKILEPQPVADAQIPQRLPRPKQVPNEQFGPPAPDRSPSPPDESQYWRDYYGAQDRKVLREAAAQKRRDRQRKADWLRNHGLVVPPNSVLDNIETPEPQTENERNGRSPFGKPKLKTRPQPEEIDINKCPDVKDEEKKPCPTRILFRGDSRTPLPSSPALRNGIFNQGFRSRGPESTTLKDYVFKNADGIYIGTSKIKPPAITFATSNLKTGAKRDGYVYEICDPGGGIDISEWFKDDLEFFQSNYRKQQEVAFERAISNENIKGATFYDRNRNRGIYYSNPNYKYKP
jgi:RHS repeat-associated protein